MAAHKRCARHSIPTLNRGVQMVVAPIFGNIWGDVFTPVASSWCGISSYPKVESLTAVDLFAPMVEEASKYRRLCA